MPLFKRCLELSHALELQAWLPGIASVLGYTYALVERLADAVPLLEQALQGVNSARLMFFRHYAAFWLSEAALLSGRLADARALAEPALALSRQRQEQGHEAWVLRLLGDIAMHRDSLDIEQAQTHYQQALALAEELGMRPLQAHCHRALGTLYRQTGQSDQARAALSTAIEMYRDMAMTFWLPETQAVLAVVAG